MKENKIDEDLAIGSAIIMVGAPLLGVAYKYGYTPKSLDDITDSLVEVSNRLIGTNLSSLEGYGFLAAVGVISGVYMAGTAFGLWNQYSKPEVKKD